MSASDVLIENYGVPMVTVTNRYGIDLTLEAATLSKRRAKLHVLEPRTLRTLCGRPTEQKNRGGEHDGLCSLCEAVMRS